MAYTIQIKNDSGSVQTWAGKEFSVGEEYTVPTDTNRIKYQTNSGLLTAIGDGAALVGDGTEYFSDVNQAIDWLKGHDTRPTDIDNVPYSRGKVTKTGWHNQVHAVEFETSKLSSLYNKDESGTDLGFATIKYYNSSDVELTAGTQSELDSNCVKTVVDWEPDHDFEIVGGALEQVSAPASDVRLYVVAVPDLTVAQGGSVPFVQGGLNLRHLSKELDIDGKAPKLMAYDATYHTNKFRIIAKHNTGFNCPILVLFKIFRENA